MNILYLLQVLKTDKLSELVAVIDAPPLDVNLAIWDAIDRGEIEVDEDKNSVVPLKEAEPWRDEDLTNKLLRTIQHYVANETNITRGRMNALIKEPITEKGYGMHDYFMSLQSLVDSGQVIEEVIEVAATKKRPYHKFVFLCLADNPNEEWNAKAVNKWIDGFEKKK